jgi:hypothetical protein
LFLSVKCFVAQSIIPAWSLLVLFPGVNLITAWFFAFKAWPMQGATKAGSEVG